MTAAETKQVRMRSFNETTGVFGFQDTDGVIKGGNHHPHRCRCQGHPEPDPSLDTGRDAVGMGSCGPTGDTTPHKHRVDGSCARCMKCEAYEPAIPLMHLTECDACRGHTAGHGVSIGVTCRCGKHFHIGSQLLGEDPAREIECPRCTMASRIIELADAPEPVKVETQ